MTSRLAFALAPFLLAGSAAAQELHVMDAWIAEAPPTAGAHAAYVTISNTGDVPGAIVEVEAAGYGAARLHLSEEVNGVATMSPVARLEVPAGEQVEMRPGGLHIMLMGPQDAVDLGDVVPLTLVLEDGAEVPARAEVRPRD